MNNSTKILTYTVPQKADGFSLHNYLKQQGFPKHMLIMLKQGGITVNGKFHRMIDPVTTGDFIEICFAAETPVLAPNPLLHIPIIYEDEDIVVFSKPANTLVHPASPKFSDAIGNYFSFLYPNRLFRPIGRLDRDTTGLSPVAKNRLAAVMLSQNIKKTYTAIAEGILETENGTIDAPLLRVPGPTIKRTVDPCGQTAITHYTVLQRLNNHTLVSIKLETGRTHQIRAHFSHIGHPLAGDSLYGGSTESINRQALHCHTIQLIQPTSKEHISLTAPLPEDMLKLLQADA